VTTAGDLAAARRLRPARDEIRIGVSACLLGQRVRWDGEHKKDVFVAGLPAPSVRCVPFCPEVEIGLGIPREPIRLERRGGKVRLVGIRSGADHTAAMHRFTRRAARELDRLGLCGFVFKSDSPSCGPSGVPVHGKGGARSRRGRGLFAAGITAALPLLPVEEEGRLRDPRVRESFVERALAYRRLRSFFGGRWTPGDLVRFHAAERLLLLAHDPQACRDLGRLVAAATEAPQVDVGGRYRCGFMAAMARLPTRSRHASVLRHAASHLRGLLPGDERAELAAAIEGFRKGRVALAAPITRIRRHAHRHRVASLEGQSYLEPHPIEQRFRSPSPTGGRLDR
jgi:uncharacterized protein YbbK (DUF523 family)/uncharacterized protein YbgA (DUF1722 family)